MSTYFLSLVSTQGEGASGDYTIQFNKTLKFDDGSYEVALVSAEIPNTWYNVSAKIGNNKLHYSDDGGLNFTTLTVPDGIYSVSSLNTQMQELIGNNYIEFGADASRLRVFVILKNGYQVNFNHPDTFRNLLGFSGITITTQNTKVYATNRPNITNNNDSFYILCDMINSTYSRLGPSFSNVLYAFSFTVSSGSMQSVVPSERVHLPLSGSYFDRVNIKIVNQDGKVMDFNGERTIVNLKVRQITPIRQAMF